MLRASNFFNDAEKKKISEATCSAESETIGEIAVMLVDGSSEYREAEMLGGILIGSLLSLIISVSYFHSSVWTFMPMAFILFFPSSYLFRKFPFLKITLTGFRRKEEAVQQRALRAFYEKGLYRTKMNTGVLFFISLLERKVWVLADKGIYEKIHQDALNKFAIGVSLGIKGGRSCDALCENIKEAGDLLAEHFPLTPGDTNELSDDVITE